MIQTAKTDIDEIRTQLVIVAVALEFGIPYTQILTKNKGSSRIAFARQLGMYLLNIVYDVNVTRVGKAFLRDRSTASHACRVIEDLRDDPVLDQKINNLEGFLRLAPHPALHQPSGVNP